MDEVAGAGLSDPKVRSFFRSNDTQQNDPRAK